MRTVCQQKISRNLPSSHATQIQARRRHKRRSERGARAVRQNGRGLAWQVMTLACPGLTRTQLPTASSRPLRPSALPAPRARITVRPLSSCGSGGPYRAKLLIADPRDRIEEIVMHGDWKGLVFLLNEDRNQIL